MFLLSLETRRFLHDRPQKSKATKRAGSDSPFQVTELGSETAAVLHDNSYSANKRLLSRSDESGLAEPDTRLQFFNLASDCRDLPITPRSPAIQGEVHFNGSRTFDRSPVKPRRGVSPLERRRHCGTSQ